MKLMVLRATALGAVLLVAACGGGDGGPSSSNPDPGIPSNPGGTGTVFTPAADDLPIDRKVGNDYPHQTTALVLDVEYLATQAPVAAAGKRPFIQYSDGRCIAQSDPLSYAGGPGSETTLATLNRTQFQTKTIFKDECLPEIKVKLKSSDPDFKDDTGAAAGQGKMRVRGSSTRAAAQKSFRVKTDGKMWFGEDTFQLNKHPYDATRVRNKLAFDLMKSIPHHQSQRTQFAEIKYTDSISRAPGTTPADNPEGSLGLFTHIEKFGKSYLKNRGWPVDGANIYKASEFNFNNDLAYGCVAGNALNAELGARLELEVGDGNKCDSVQAMLQDLQNEESAFQPTFDKYFNRNNYLTWLASVILFGNYDTTSQNFALYQHPGNGKFYFLPWDYDAAFDYSHQPKSDVYADWAYGVGNWWDSALHRRFMMAPGNIELLEAAVAEVRAKYLTRDAIKKLLDAYKPSVQSFVTKAPDSQHLGVTPAQWEAEYEGLVASIDTNYQFFLESLKRPMPFWYSVIGADNAPISELRWDWPDPWHPQGHKITYEVQFLPTAVGDKNVGQGKTAFDVPGAPIVRKDMGPATSLPFVQDIPVGPYWIRVLAKDATNGTSTYAFDQSWDTTSDKGRFGVLCKKLPLNTNCDHIE